jgi:hypothetical protein
MFLRLLARLWLKDKPLKVRSQVYKGELPDQGCLIFGNAYNDLLHSYKSLHLFFRWLRVNHCTANISLT